MKFCNFVYRTQDNRGAAGIMCNEILGFVLKLPKMFLLTFVADYPFHLQQIQP